MLVCVTQLGHWRMARLHGLFPSPKTRLTSRATGYLTGDQSRQTEGNLEAEKASVDYKQAKTGNPLAVPIPSADGVKGKMESVAGMVTGDQELQKEGNAKAEAAAWKDVN